MKKYIYFIISIILILLVTASVFIWKEQYKKESKSPSINNTETSDLSVNNDSNNVPETIVSDIENKTDTQTAELKEIETEKSNDEDNTAKEVQKPTTSPKATSTTTSKKATSVENTKKEESKNTVKVEEKKETVTPPSTQNKQQATSKQDTVTSNDNKKEEVKKEETVVRCTNNNNHGMGIGNSGKWFSSKDEAIAYYKSQIKYWGDWWENTSIDDTEADETYRKNCPSGYEVWDCMYCGKWTINFYYR